MIQAASIYVLNPLHGFCLLHYSTHKGVEPFSNVVKQYAVNVTRGTIAESPGTGYLLSSGTTEDISEDEKTSLKIGKNCSPSEM